MVSLRDGTAHALILEQQYAASTLAVLIGLGLLVGDQPARRSVGALLVVIATLIIPTSVAYLPFAAFFVAGRADRWRRLGVAAGVCVVASLCSTWASTRLSPVPTHMAAYRDFSLGRLGRGVRPSFASISASLDQSVAVPLLVGCILVLAWRWSALPNDLRRLFGATVAFALVWFVAFSANAWVENGGFWFRYFFPLYLAGIRITLVIVAICEVIAAARGAVGNMISHDMSMAIGLSTSSIALPVAMVSMLDTSVDDSDAVRSTREFVAATKEGDVRFVVRDYWQVWPTVFSGRHSGLDLIGISTRSEPMADDVRRAVRVRSESETISTSILCVGRSIDDCLLVKGSTRQSTVLVHRQ